MLSHQEMLFFCIDTLAMILKYNNRILLLKITLLTQYCNSIAIITKQHNITLLIIKFYSLNLSYVGGITKCMTYKKDFKNADLGNSKLLLMTTLILSTYINTLA